VQWRDVDLDSGLLHIRRRYYRSAYAPPKTRYGRRVLPLTPAMAALLRSRRDLLEPGPPELVWPSRTGRPLNPDSTRARVLKPAALRAAVPWASWQHPETHVRHAPVPRGLEHQSRSALPRSSLSCLHPGGLRALPSRGHAQQRVPRRHRRHARPTVGG
jgi:integrase